MDKTDWIDYRLPNGTQRRESVDAIEGCDGYSIEDARDAYAKRRSQKRENKVFDMQRGSDLTFDKLIKWYLNLNSVIKLSSYTRVQSALANFIKSFIDCGNHHTGGEQGSKYYERREIAS